MNIPISHEPPVVYSELKSRFNANWNDGLIIAYDGKIHSKADVPPQKIVHESVHLKEQDKIGNEVWWRCYLDNSEFRLNEEKKAYFAEAQFIKKYIKDREACFHIISEIATGFSSELYGNIISKTEALKLLL